MGAPVKISLKKLEKIAVLSLENAVRLHLDSIVLFKNGSFPSAFQLSVLALEEFGKAKALDDFIWNTTTHGNKRDYAFEMKYLERLYDHPWKQLAALARERFRFSAKYIQSLETKALEAKKQRAVYVGLSRIRGKMDIKGRISSPSAIKQKDAQQQIALLNDIFLEIIVLAHFQGIYFDIRGMDYVMSIQLRRKLEAWTNRSGIKKRRKLIFKNSPPPLTIK
ncbi:MAG: hypothetical protein BGO55_03310 [Sphingobacteriales bacterium 50-39]|nr:AbiV family abortive infection protein [Sphingobacteriales bacterium]OJW55582.1 MAG: hypothetical protein BGO55_03310 [Sphingobacteriales bacterium 50-39]